MNETKILFALDFAVQKSATGLDTRIERKHPAFQLTICN